jgi:tetratricopeptide (TPR) repeat protein
VVGGSVRTSITWPQQLTRRLPTTAHTVIDKCGQRMEPEGLPGPGRVVLFRVRGGLGGIQIDHHLALHLFEELGDQIGQAQTYLELSWMFEHRDHHEDALFHGRRALALFNAADNRSGRAAALYRVAHQKAFACCQQALTLCRELSDRRSESHTLSVLGYTHNSIGNHREAIACYHQSFRLHRELGDRYPEANVITRPRRYLARYRRSCRSA